MGYYPGQAAPRDDAGILPPGVILSAVTFANKKRSRFWVADSYGLALQTMTRTTRAGHKGLKALWNLGTSRSYLVPWHEILTYRMSRSRGVAPYTTDLILKTAITHHTLTLSLDTGQIHKLLGPWLVKIEQRRGRPGVPVAAPKQT
jgi:hypothetical protein